MKRVLLRASTALAFSLVASLSPTRAANAECLTYRDAADLRESVEQFVANLVGRLRPLQAENKCAFLKLREAGKHEFRSLACFAKAAGDKRGLPVDPKCTIKSTATLADLFAQWDAKASLGCLPTGNGNEIDALVRSFVAAITTTLVPIPEAVSQCARLKLQATAVLARQLLLCEAKAAGSGGGTDEHCRRSALDKFDTQFGKGELKENPTFVVRLPLRVNSEGEGHVATSSCSIDPADPFQKTCPKAMKKCAEGADILDCLRTYPFRSRVVVEAVPDDGYCFLGWQTPYACGGSIVPSCEIYFGANDPSIRTPHAEFGACVTPTPTPSPTPTGTIATSTPSPSPTIPIATPTPADGCVEFKAGYSAYNSPSIGDSFRAFFLGARGDEFCGGPPSAGIELSLAEQELTGRVRRGGRLVAFCAELTDGRGNGSAIYLQDIVPGQYGGKSLKLLSNDGDLACTGWIFTPP